MAKRSKASRGKSRTPAKSAVRRPPAKPAGGQRSQRLPKIAPGELQTLLDFVRYAVSRFQEAKLIFAHGTTDPVAEAAFLIGEALHLRPDQFESFATASCCAMTNAVTSAGSLSMILRLPIQNERCR